MGLRAKCRFLLQKAEVFDLTKRLPFENHGRVFVFGGNVAVRAHVDARRSWPRARPRLARARPRAAMSAAVAPPGSGLDANALVDLDLLQGELEPRGQAEMWCAQRSSR